MTDPIAVEVVFLTPRNQFSAKLLLPPGTTAAEAVSRCGFSRSCPEYNFDALDFGVWGRPVEREHTLCHGDRVEIYRPLCMDPKEARRELAARGLTMADAAPRSLTGSDRVPGRGGFPQRDRPRK